MKVTLHRDVEADIADFVAHYEMALIVNQRDLLSNDAPLARIRAGDPVSGGIPGLPDSWGCWFMKDEAGNYMLMPRLDSPSGVSYTLTRNEPETVLFVLTVTRYSLGWVRLTLWENRGTTYGDRLLQWIEARWKSGGILKVPQNRAKKPSYSRPGRKKDPWNQRAINRLRDGEAADIVRADWNMDYAAGTGTRSEDTPQGEARLWRRLVWQRVRAGLNSN